MGDWDLPRDPLAALRDGNPGPFEDFVRTHARLLVAWFRRQGAGLHRAEDLTQDVMIKLHQHAPRYQPQERFTAYLFRVARNVWIDDRRRMGARPVGVSLERPSEDGAPRAMERPTPRPGPVDQAADREGEARLRAALAELPEHHRAVFELGALEGLSYSEVGAILDIPVGTVKSRMFYAVRRLREALGEEGEE